jgi:PLP dependent protein
MIQTVLETIQSTCEHVGRNPNSVRVIAVTKGRTPEEIQARVLAYGNFALGENRVQEALPKIETMPQAEFHLIGHLQTNKAKFCKAFAMIHSIDSLRLLEELAKRGAVWGFVPPVLLEVNVAREPQKHGLEPEEVASTLKAAKDLGLDVRGLMTIAPYGKLEQARACFRELREMRDHLGLVELSMGMSEDYQAAIEEGATMIRPGRVLFG